MQKIYSSDSRSAFIEQIESGRKKVSEIARELGIAENTLYSWRKQLEDDEEYDFVCRREKKSRQPKHERIDFQETD